MPTTGARSAGDFLVVFAASVFFAGDGLAGDFVAGDLAARGASAGAALAGLSVAEPFGFGALPRRLARGFSVSPASDLSVLAALGASVFGAPSGLPGARFAAAPPAGLARPRPSPPPPLPGPPCPPGGQSANRGPRPRASAGPMQVTP